MCRTISAWLSVCKHPGMRLRSAFFPFCRRPRLWPRTPPLLHAAAAVCGQAPCAGAVSLAGVAAADARRRFGAGAKNQASYSQVPASLTLCVCARFFSLLRRVIDLCVAVRKNQSCAGLDSGCGQPRAGWRDGGAVSFFLSSPLCVRPLTAAAAARFFTPDVRHGSRRPRAPRAD